jgi:hypothetical protein
MAGQHNDGDKRVRIGPGLPDHLGQFDAVEHRHRPVEDHDVGQVVRKGFETGGAVLGLIDLARAKAVQQRADDTPHMRIVVDDEKAQTPEIDTNHAARPNAGATGASPLRQRRAGPLKDQLRIRGLATPAGTRSRFTSRLSAAIVAPGFWCQVGGQP